ncbi:hypothetical protein [Deinococcus sedimenti]|uniref:DUF2339 domain-containing protein n=1 Tax=Deinococcus sedimenti TaxID=1867090 RepID=A0ABQ2S4C3_9DEIO|nr:hypothetical protein [Deinococcus sedimenti]GGR89351.1 hypothetical protein GCM10008960_15500 [Deinococcus sedimenti]
MSPITELLLVGLLVVLIVRSVRLERRLNDVRRQVDALTRSAPSAAPPRLPAAAPAAAEPAVEPERVGLGAAAPAAVVVPPAWPDEPPPQPVRRRWMPDLDLGAPEFSRARMSVIGGGLVIGGLAWTLRALSLPGWTTLVAVYAFAALLWWTARGVPQPVAGALRGLAYASGALGLGGLAQHLGLWGPGVVMAGLLVLSALMAGRSLRAGEPLLAAMAGAGAAVSSWMLGDDLGVWSPLVMGVTGLIPALAVPALLRALRSEDTLTGADAPAGLPRESSLMLTVLVAAALPAGHLLAALGHVPDPLSGPVPGALTALHLTGWGVWAWVSGTLLTCGTAAVLLRGAVALPPRAGPDDRPGYLELGVAAAMAAAAPLLAAAGALGVGVRLSQGGSLVALLLLAVGGAALSAWGWRTQLREAAVGRTPGAALAGAVAGGATAGTAALLGSAVLGLLGARSRPLAYLGLGVALTRVGLAARSRTWVRLGGVLTGVSALVAVTLTLRSGAAPTLVWGTAAALLVAWVAAARVARRGWRPEAQAHSVALGIAATVFGLGGLLEAAGVALLFGAALWTEGTLRRAGAPLEPLRAGAQVAVTGASILLAVWGVFRALPAVPVSLTALLLALLGSVLALLASRVDAPARTAARRTTPQGVGGADALAPAASFPALPGAPASQFAACLAVAALLAALGVWTGIDRASSVGLAAAALALVGHRLALRRADVVSTAALLVGAGFVSLNLASEVLTRAASPWRAMQADGTADRWALPFTALALLGAWALLHTPTGRRLWTRWTPQGASLPPMPARIWRAPLIAGGLALAVSTLWLALAPRLAVMLDGPLGTLGSVGALITGVLVALGAWRWGGVGRGGARPLWDMGVGIGAAAGVKAALLDAPLYDLPRVASGLAVLVTGLALLLLAVRAPRPDATVGQDGREEDSGALRVPQPVVPSGDTVPAA